MKTNQEMEIPYEILMDCFTQLLSAGIGITITQADNTNGLITLNVSYDNTRPAHLKTLQHVEQDMTEFTDFISSRYSL